MTKQLYRSRTNQMLGGVCGGLAEYFDVDANLLRLLFVVFSALTGVGVLVYFALWLIVPEEAKQSEEKSSLGERVREGAEDIADRAREIGDSLRDKEATKAPVVSFFVSIALIVVGVVFLLRNLGFRWMRWIAIDTIWPAIIIVVGLIFLWRWIRHSQ